MILRNFVEEQFDKFIKETFGTKPDIFNLINGHGKKKECIDNLTREFKNKKFNRLLRDKDNTYSRERITLYTKQFAQTFSQCVLELKRREIRSMHAKVMDSVNLNDPIDSGV